MQYQKVFRLLLLSRRMAIGGLQISQVILGILISLASCFTSGQLENLSTKCQNLLSIESTSTACDLASNALANCSLSGGKYAAVLVIDLQNDSWWQGNVADMAINLTVHFPWLVVITSSEITFRGPAPPRMSLLASRDKGQRWRHLQHYSAACPASSTGLGFDMAASTDDDLSSNLDLRCVPVDTSVADSAKVLRQEWGLVLKTNNTVLRSMPYFLSELFYYR